MQQRRTTEVAETLSVKPSTSASVANVGCAPVAVRPGRLGVHGPATRPRSGPAARHLPDHPVRGSERQGWAPPATPRDCRRARRPARPPAPDQTTPPARRPPVRPVDTERRVKDLHRLRQAQDPASSGTSSPASPRGSPRPSHAGRRSRIAAAARSDRPTLSAMSAPRPQRASINDRVTSPSFLIAGRCATGVRIDHPGENVAPTTRTPAAGAANRCAWSCALRNGRRLRQRSHPRRVAVQAASLSSRASNRSRPTGRRPPAVPRRGACHQDDRTA